MSSPHKAYRSCDVLTAQKSQEANTRIRVFVSWLTDHLSVGLFLYDAEVLLAYSAERANPVIGDVFKCCTGSDSSFGISLCGIVDPAASVTNVLFHNDFEFSRVL